jgi:hypothetical protein
MDHALDGDTVRGAMWLFVLVLAATARDWWLGKRRSR